MNCPEFRRYAGKGLLALMVCTAGLLHGCASISEVALDTPDRSAQLRMITQGIQEASRKQY